MDEDEKPDNPIAFPCQRGVDFVPGMSLRDFFAGKAMSALIPEQMHPADTAETAYRIADAMLVERERED